MIVVDDSAILKTLLSTVSAKAVETRLFDPSERLHVPYLFYVESPTCFVGMPQSATSRGRVVAWLSLTSPVFG